MHLIKQYWKPLLWTILILILCLMPKSVEPQPSWLTKIPHFDKLIHFGLYTVLGFLYYISNPRQSLLFFVLVCLYAFILGGSIELIQPCVGRSCELLDLVTDMLGIIIGSAFDYSIVKSRIRNFNF